MLQELSRFPLLQQQIYEVVKKMLRERLKPTNQMVQNLVDIEISYINTSHPDFKAMTAVNQFLEKKADNRLLEKVEPLRPKVIRKNQLSCFKKMMT